MLEHNELRLESRGDPIGFKHLCVKLGCCRGSDDVKVYGSVVINLKLIVISKLLYCILKLSGISEEAYLYSEFVIVIAYLSGEDILSEDIVRREIEEAFNGRDSAESLLNYLVEVERACLEYLRAVEVYSLNVGEKEGESVLAERLEKLLYLGFLCLKKLDEVGSDLLTVYLFLYLALLKECAYIVLADSVEYRLKLIELVHRDESRVSAERIDDILLYIDVAYEIVYSDKLKEIVIIKVADEVCVSAAGCRYGVERDILLLDYGYISAESLDDAVELIVREDQIHSNLIDKLVCVVVDYVLALCHTYGSDYIVRMYVVILEYVVVCLGILMKYVLDELVVNVIGEDFNIYNAPAFVKAQVSLCRCHKLFSDVSIFGLADECLDIVISSINVEPFFGYHILYDIVRAYLIQQSIVREKLIENSGIREKRVNNVFGYQLLKSGLGEYRLYIVLSEHALINKSSNDIGFMIVQIGLDAGHAQKCLIYRRVIEELVYGIPVCNKIILKNFFDLGYLYHLENRSLVGNELFERCLVVGEDSVYDLGSYERNKLVELRRGYFVYQRSLINEIVHKVLCEDLALYLLGEHKLDSVRVHQTLKLLLGYRLKNLVDRDYREHLVYRYDLEKHIGGEILIEYLGGEACDELLEIVDRYVTGRELGQNFGRQFFSAREGIKNVGGNEIGQLTLGKISVLYEVVYLIGVEP